MERWAELGCWVRERKRGSGFPGAAREGQEQVCTCMAGEGRRCWRKADKVSCWWKKSSEKKKLDFNLCWVGMGQIGVNVRKTSKGDHAHRNINVSILCLYVCKQSPVLSLQAKSAACSPDSTKLK